MTEEQIELAKRAVACKGWRWMPGMAWFDGRFLQYRVQSEAHAVVVDEGGLPDLTDPATLGCLLALVREATTAYASLTFEPGYLHTEVENLVAALEAAPQ
jgi:hypothetical protein